MNKCILLALLSLCACGTQIPVYKPVNVEVPVSVPCKIPAVQKPIFALAGVKTSDSIYDKTKAVLIEIEQHKAYEAQLEAAEKACD
ncbi:MAG: hypothetical protein KGL39_17945 [Patescibacteria group bacterium]|nr:hypothetical protein [Patescibacteria group bacterium]